MTALETEFAVVPGLDLSPQPASSGAAPASSRQMEWDYFMASTYASAGKIQLYFYQLPRLPN